MSYENIDATISLIGCCGSLAIPSTSTKTKSTAVKIFTGGSAQVPYKLTHSPEFDYTLNVGGRNTTRWVSDFAYKLDSSFCFIFER